MIYEDNDILGVGSYNEGTDVVVPGTPFDENFDYDNYDLDAVLEECGLSKEGWDSINASIFYAENLAGLSSDEQNKFIQTEQCAVLEKGGLVGKATFVKLNKADDLERRISICALEIAKERKDPLYDKFIFYKAKEKECLQKINDRYLNPATKVAKIQQKEYLKLSKNGKVPVAGLPRKKSGL